jgi:hypothetical protein
MEVSRAQWAGRVISAVCVLFLLFDGLTKTFQESHVVSSMVLLGYPPNLTVFLGVLLLACTAVYVIPATSVLGAILLTGFLGGATASALRIGDPGHPALFSVAFGVLVWLGLYLREERLCKLIPFFWS